MPRRLPGAVQIFVFDASDVDNHSTAQVELFQPNDIERLVHETRLPGGFWRLSFQLPMTVGEYWDWRINRLLYRILVTESLATIFEGRLEDIDGDPRTPTLTFWGYWRNFTDSVNNNKSYTKDYNTTGDQILSDMLTNGFHADTLQLSTDETDIEAPGVTIDQTYDDHLNLWQVLTDPTKGVLTFGNSSDQQMDLAVWEDRQISYTARNPSAVTWKSYIDSPNLQGVRRFPVKIAWRTVANALTAIYSSTSETSVNTDTDSITKYLRREFTVPDIGTSAVGTANARRDTELAARKDPQQQSESIVLTRVFDSNGREATLCRVRAGDVLQIPDFIPKSSGVSGATLDALTTFFIEETRCDHERGELTVRPDAKSNALSAILARNRLT